MKLKHLAPVLLACSLPALSGCIAGLTYTAGGPITGHLYLECDVCSTTNNSAQSGNGFTPEVPTTTSEIVAFAKDAAGTPTATSTITAQSANARFAGMKVDASGNLYTTSYSYNTDLYTILVYANGASGAATPIRTITSPLMESLDSFAVAPDGTVFFNDDDNGLLRFAPASNGASTPTVFSDLYFGSLAVDTSGNLYGIPYCCTGIYVYNAGFSSETPSRTFTPADSASFELDYLALDSSGNVYISGYSYNLNASQIEVFPANSSGTTAASRTISGSNTLLGDDESMVVDGQGNLYVRTYVAQPQNNAVHVPLTRASHFQPLSNPYVVEVLQFNSTANGNVAPTDTFTTTLRSESSYDIAVY